MDENADACAKIRDTGKAEANSAKRDQYEGDAVIVVNLGPASFWRFLTVLLRGGLSAKVVRDIVSAVCVLIIDVVRIGSESHETPGDCTDD